MGNACSFPGEISVAAWGNSTGEEWKYTSGICKIFIRHGELIHSIMFKSSETSDYSIFGGSGGLLTDTVDIDFPSEFLTGVSGTYSENGITSLKFQTNRIEYGPFGVESGTAFSFNTEDGFITGFHGRAGQFLNAIGIFILPGCSMFLSTEVETKQHSGIGSTDQLLLRPCLPPPRSAGPWGGSGGRDWDDGVSSDVVGVDVRLNIVTDVISAVRFYCKKKDIWLPLHGGHGSVGMSRKRIEFKKENEFVIGVEGFYGILEGINIIRSLTFISNKAKYGPIGAEIGTYFSSLDFSDCNRKVVGFHGRSGAYLNAIGVHTEYF